MQTATTTVSDLTGLKAKLKATWMSGAFDRIAQLIAAGGAAFVERLRLRPGQRVLDVACGTGNLSFPAARAGAIVTGLDFAPNLLAMARERAKAEGVSIQFDEGDVEEMPYTDASFDEIVTMFGAMFTPRPNVVASEMARVCRPGGRLTMANWSPDGFIGQLFKITGRHVTPPPMPSPLLWGDVSTVRERLGIGFTDVRCTRRDLIMDFPMSPAQAVEFFRAWYGPTQRAFAALDEAGQADLRRDLEDLWTTHNRAADRKTVIVAKYLEVSATRA